MDIETLTPVSEAGEVLLPLRDGERITRAEFERRYAAHEEPRKAELIEGVVYVASPVSYLHCVPHGRLTTCAGLYSFGTPGVILGDNGTVRLREQDEPQPDVLLRIDAGGQSHVSTDNYVVDAPELVGEVSVTTTALDRGPRLRAYQAAGVREYLLWRVLDEVLEWFILRDGIYEPLQPGADGILRSEIFPGLWLDAAALVRDDTAAVLRTLQAGLASPEHTAFVLRLAQNQ